MNRPCWDATRQQIWYADGSLRDLYIKKTTLADWRRLVEMAAQYQCEYLFDGKPCHLPDVARIFENRVGTHLLRIRLGSVTINSHFFVAEEIELDIDPRNVTGPE